MILARTYAARGDIPKGASDLYEKRGALFFLRGAVRDFVADNPWDADNWNLTKQGQFISQHGNALAHAFAANAGSAVGATQPRVIPVPGRNFTVIVQRRNITTGGSGTSDGGDDNALVAGLVTKT